MNDSFLLFTAGVVFGNNFDKANLEKQYRSSYF